MKEELYYLVPRSLRDKLLDAALTGRERKFVIAIMDNCNKINLSDETIESKAETYAEQMNSCYSNDFNGYQQALKDLKQQIK